MNNLSRAVLVLLLAVPLFGQSSDFAMLIDATLENPRPDGRLPIGNVVDYLVQWTIDGSFDAAEVAIEVSVPGVIQHLGTADQMSCTAASPVRCTFNGAPRNGFLQIEVRVDQPGVHTATARVLHSGSADANSSNDVATHTFEAIGLPSVSLTPAVYIGRLDPGQSGPFSAVVYNNAPTPATNVVLTVTLPAGGTIVNGSTQNEAHTCAVANNTLVCHAPSLAQNEALAIQGNFEAPSRTSGGWFEVHITVTSAEEDLNPADNDYTRRIQLVRPFMVTTVADEGGGSLRQAILDVNALCSFGEACAIVFQIPAPVPKSGWFTIQPRTPLPEIVASLKIHGVTQTIFTGDTNPDGPEIEINGALLQESAGLRLRPNCDVDVRGLAVNGFSGYGIAVRRATGSCGGEDVPFSFVRVEGNYLGTDPRGRSAKPNRRGLGVFSDEATVHDNLISGNHRSGIYVESRGFITVQGNRIGVGADGSPLGNGAGILFDLRSPSPGADVMDNVIAYNDGMAIARTRIGEIQVSRNSIFDNLQQGIDVDIDGPTAHRANDTDVPNAPVLFSAAYDAGRNATIVRGHIDSDAAATFRFVDVYASSRLSVWSTPQAEQMVATQVHLPSGHQDFEVVVPGDHRGKWITATFNAARATGFARAPRGGISTQNHLLGLPTNTSELSNAVVAR